MGLSRCRHDTITVALTKSVNLVVDFVDLPEGLAAFLRLSWPCLSFLRSRSFTICGFALPWVVLITRPTNQPATLWLLPLNCCLARSGFPLMTWSTAASISLKISDLRRFSGLRLPLDPHPSPPSLLENVLGNTIEIVPSDKVSDKFADSGSGDWACRNILSVFEDRSARHDPVCCQLCIPPSATSSKNSAVSRSATRTSRP